MGEETKIGEGLLAVKPKGKLIAEIYEDGDRIVLHPITEIPFLSLAHLLTQLATAYIQIEMSRQQSKIVLANPIPGLRAQPDNGSGGKRS